MKRSHTFLALVLAMMVGMLLDVTPAAARDHGPHGAMAASAAVPPPLAHALHVDAETPAHPNHDRGAPFGSCDTCPVAASCAPVLATVASPTDFILHRVGLKTPMAPTRHLLATILTRDPPVPRA